MPIRHALAAHLDAVHAPDILEDVALALAPDACMVARDRGRVELDVGARMPSDEDEVLVDLQAPLGPVHAAHV